MTFSGQQRRTLSRNKRLNSGQQQLSQDSSLRVVSLHSNMEERERKSVKPYRKQRASGSGAAAAGGDEEDALNVCSEKFDPLLALYSPAAPPLPFPNIKCFNNVAEYESFLKGGRGRAKPENVEKRQREAMKGVVDPERIERLKRLMVNDTVSESEEGESSAAAPGRRRRQKPQKNVLTRMSRRFSCITTESCSGFKVPRKQTTSLLDFLFSWSHLTLNIY